MSENERVPLDRALAAATAIVGLVRDVTDRVEIAGSIRRKIETIGAIEIVAVPRMVASTVPDGFFGTAEITTNLLLERLDELVASGRLADHPTDPKRGERYAKLLDSESGMQLDLFMVLPPAQFGIIHLIRTGPAAYSEAFVKKVRAKGYHVKDGALHWGTMGCGSRPCAVAPTPEERDVFARTQIPFTPAQFRGVR